MLYIILLIAFLNTLTASHKRGAMSKISKNVFIPGLGSRKKTWRHIRKLNVVLKSKYQFQSKSSENSTETMLKSFPQ